jgi:nucleoside-diphosphate-sugar epimerase
LTDWSQQRVVVGGGCGLFGSYLVPVIVGAGARVTVVDHLDGTDVSALDRVRADITFVEGDLRDRLTCESVFQGCDLFVNLAATAFGIGFSRAHHGQMLIDNILCGLVPLQAAQRNGVRHVVTVSTSCVYPDDAPVPTPEMDPFAGDPEQVNAGYGWAKRIQELASRYVADEHGMRATILRPFNLYGGRYPWRSAEQGHVIPSLVKRILDGEDPLVVWGSGEQRRNFLHAADAAEVAWRIVASGAEGPVNIGYEDDTRIADLVALICDVTGRRPALIFDTSRPDGYMRKSSDATLLRTLTDGYVPRISLREGIEDMVRWYHARFR